ncbi:MAG: ATPase, T2SS/T4P/T4SS family [Deltaproteobacteria bacterium]|nr:ATPase, T2SS/T4P/T4SS family [Deltaproteobacteria bacterium]
MAKVDKFLTQLMAYEADALLVESGDNLYLRKGTEKKPLMDVKPGAITNAHVAALFNEIAPVHIQVCISCGENASWDYRWGECLFRIELCFVEGRIAARVRAVADPVVVAPAPRLVVVPAAHDAAAPPIARFFRAVDDGRGCDLYLTAGHFPMARVDGEMAALQGFPVLAAADLHKLIEEILPARARAALEATGDATFGWELDGARVRCTVLRDASGTGGVFRRFPQQVPSVVSLGSPAGLVELCQLRTGLVIVAGVGGSGRSTTLAAMVDWINHQRADHVVTVEDTVEILHAPKRCLINQRQVGEHTGTCAQALEAAARERPEVVVVGAVRDLATMRAMIEMAGQGLVIAVMSAANASAAVEAIVAAHPLQEQEAARGRLAGVLQGVVTQIARGDPRFQANQRVRVVDAAGLGPCLQTVPTRAAAPMFSLADPRSASPCAINDALRELVLLGVLGRDRRTLGPAAGQLRVA